MLCYPFNTLLFSPPPPMHYWNLTEKYNVYKFSGIAWYKTTDQYGNWNELWLYIPQFKSLLI